MEGIFFLQFCWMVQQTNNFLWRSIRLLHLFKNIQAGSFLAIIQCQQSWSIKMYYTHRRPTEDVEVRKMWRPHPKLMPKIQISISKSLREIKKAENGADEWNGEVGSHSPYKRSNLGAAAWLVAWLDTSCSIMHFLFSFSFSQRRFETFLIAFSNDLLSVSLTVGPLTATETEWCIKRNALYYLINYNTQQNKRLKT